MSDMGYLGGTLTDGSAFLGKIGESNVEVLAGQYGLPASAQYVVGFAESADKLAVAVDCADQAWVILASLTSALPTLSVRRVVPDALRVSWPTTPGGLLQTTPSLQPLTWADWTNAYEESEAQTYVEVATTNAGGFFRLEHSFQSESRHYCWL